MQIGATLLAVLLWLEAGADRQLLAQGEAPLQVHSAQWVGQAGQRLLHRFWASKMAVTGRPGAAGRSQGS